jgi:hypothetical protein
VAGRVGNRRRDVKRITTAVWVANVMHAEHDAIIARNGLVITTPGERIPTPPPVVTIEMSEAFAKPTNDTPLDLHAQRMGWDTD